MVLVYKMMIFETFLKSIFKIKAFLFPGTSRYLFWRNKLDSLKVMTSSAFCIEFLFPPRREIEMRNTILAQVLDQSARARCEVFYLHTSEILNSGRLPCCRGPALVIGCELQRVALVCWTWSTITVGFVFQWVTWRWWSLTKQKQWRIIWSKWLDTASSGERWARGSQSACGRAGPRQNGLRTAVRGITSAKLYKLERNAETRNQKEKGKNWEKARQKKKFKDRERKRERSESGENGEGWR